MGVAGVTVEERCAIAGNYRATSQALFHYSVLKGHEICHPGNVTQAQIRLAA